MKTLFFLLISCLIIFSTQSRSIIPRPQPLSSPKIDTTQDEENCFYIVNIFTNSTSPPTQDSISLRFGDANGNEILAPHLEYEHPERFQPGSWDIIVLNGTCMDPTICYLFLYRSGNDGWIPLDVFILEHLVNFFFNVSMPNNSWFGYNNCFPPPPPPSPPPPPPPSPSPPPPPSPSPPPPPPPSPSPPPPPASSYPPPPPPANAASLAVK